MLSFVTFLIIISLLVIIHEFGHYLVARLFKVKILVFSLGFGPKLFSIQGRYNEWRVSAILLGGYVRMLDEREVKVAADQRYLAFNNKKSYQKILIALAGPAFNVLFAVFAYYCVALTGVEQIKPIIASIDIQQLIKISEFKHISPGSELLSINNQALTTWAQADKKFSQLIRTNSEVSLTLKYNSQIQTYTLNSVKLKQALGNRVYLESLGLYPIAYLPTISYIEPKSSAYRGGLKVGDNIIAIDNQPIKNWFSLSSIIHDSPAKKLLLTIKRQNQLLKLYIIPESVNSDGQPIGKLGIMPTLDQNILKQNSFIQKYDLISAIGYALNECYAIVSLNIVSLSQLLTGQMSLHNLAGPISIAKAGKTAIGLGLKTFVDFLAIISLGLAIMNLLPIPILDGGHIMIYAIEWILGRTIADSVQETAFKIGLILVLGLSFLAIYNDLLRL